MLRNPNLQCMTPNETNLCDMFSSAAAKSRIELYSHHYDFDNV